MNIGRERPSQSRIRGRGAADNPRNRFERLDYEWDESQLEEGRPQTEYYRDRTRSVLTWNNSPDVGFEVSLNPYRGCEHGCIYCYARPTHEYLGLSAGLDFESRIFIKEDAPELLRRELSSPGWQPQPVALSGVTDPYQPVERKLEITRRCLQVFAEFMNPVVIVTKSHLVTRDADFLEILAQDAAAVVNLSITTLDRKLQAVMEPRASTPERRLEAIRKMVDAGVPVRVMVAPVIPGLTDQEIPSILEAARDAGARRAACVLLRLPYAVKDLFREWLQRHFPDRSARVLNRIKDVRDGQLNDTRFHHRMVGGGVYAEHIQRMFKASCSRLSLNRAEVCLSAQSFRVPGQQIQMGLFKS